MEKNCEPQRTDNVQGHIYILPYIPPPPPRIEAIVFIILPGKVLPEKLGGGVRPASQNPYPIYDQSLRYSLPYLWPDQKFATLSSVWPEPYIKILFQTCVIIGFLV